MRRSFMVLAIAFLQSGLFAGIIFGWPAFSIMFEASGVFLGAECSAANRTVHDETNECVLLQRSSISLVYTVASSLFIFSSLPGGMLLDQLGPAFASLFGGAMISAGFALAASAPDELIAPAFMLIGAGCSICYSTSLKTAFLFRQAARTTIIAAVNALFDASALVPLAVHTFSRATNAPPRLRREVIFYGLSALSALVFGLWALSWFCIRSELRATAKVAAERARDHGRAPAPAERCGQCSDGQCTDGVTSESAPLRAPTPHADWLQATPRHRWPLHEQPFVQQCKSPQLWIVSCWMSITYLRQSFFLSSVRTLLQALGDDEQEAFMSIFLSMMPLSIVIGPLFAFAIDVYGHHRVLLLLTCMSGLSFLSPLVPLLPFQVVSFTLHCTVRAGMYPTIIGYLAKLFGQVTLGSTTGVVLFTCGLTNLLVYPLSLLANDALGGDVRPVVAALAALPTLPHVLMVRRISWFRAGLSPFNRPWTDLMREVRHSEKHGGGHAARSCPVCLEKMPSSSRAVIQLSCDHVLCAGCATKMSGAGMRKCPICRHPHLLDPKALRVRRDAWRSAYGGWRQGLVRGAAGEVSSINRPPQRWSMGHATVLGDGASALVQALDLATLARPAASSGDAWKARRLPIEPLDLSPPAVVSGLRPLRRGAQPKHAQVEAGASKSGQQHPTTAEVSSTPTGQEEERHGVAAAHEWKLWKDLEA